MGLLAIAVGVSALVLYLATCVYVIKEYERGVVFRLGRVAVGNMRGPGLTFIIPFVDRLRRVDIRTVTMDVPPQEVISKDNVTIKVNAVVYFNVSEPVETVTKVTNHLMATSLCAQSTLRNILGQHELDDILAERDRICDALKLVIDRETDRWGVKVTAVEIKDIELPNEMKRAMAKQAEAERERRAKVIAAEGEYQASEKLYDAAKVLSQTPEAMQLRYLQTLVEIGIENSTTVVFPLPLEFTTAFSKLLERRA